VRFEAVQITAVEALVHDPVLAVQGVCDQHEILESSKGQAVEDSPWSMFSRPRAIKERKRISR
jgi:hypothetical protein